MKSIKRIFILITLISNLTYSAIAYVTVEGAGTQDGSSWENALSADSIQLAIGGLGGSWNDEVWVAKGIYKPTIVIDGSTDDREKFFWIRCRWLYGGFAGNETDISQRNIKENETIFSGDIGIEGDNSDNCYHVLKTEAPIDGITIQDGNANGDTSYRKCGGGAWIIDTDQTFRNCTFRNNFSIDRGGAFAALESYDSRIIFENCLFYDNESTKGGAIYAKGKSFKITNCTIVNNTADDGGGVYLEYIGGKFTNNIIWNNTPNQIYEYNAFGMSYYFNAIEDGYDGFENIELASGNMGSSNSPYFTDPENNDWTLQYFSPCRDSGVFWNSFNTDVYDWTDLIVDITNMPVPKGECRDIGAYEYNNGDLTTELPTVSTLPAVNITATTATLKGNITDNGGTQIVAKGVKYSDTSGFDPETEGTLVRSIGLFDEVEFEVLTPNLEPETTYYYRAYCESMIGSSYSTDEVSFITLDSLDVNPDINGRIYVKVDGTGDGSSWANALSGNELQNGMNDFDVEEIWVAKGKYVPTNWPANYVTKRKLDENDFIYKLIDYDESKSKYNGNTEREKHFMFKANRKMYGGFAGTETSLDQRDIRANETILSGDIGTEGYAQDNAYHVFYFYYESQIDNNSVIDGFTISDGYADGAIWDDSYFGGGIFNRCSSFKVNNCIIKNNYSVWGGGMLNGYSTSLGASKPFLYNTQITQNTADIEGGGIYDIAGYPTLINCAITQNTVGEQGSGIFHLADDWDFGYSGILKIQHCTITDNIGTEGAQLYIDTDYSNKVNIYNSILWGNNTDTIIGYNRYYSNKDKFLYCSIPGEYTGEGNIDLSLNNTGDTNSPYFTDPENNDYSLQYESACKDMAIYLYKTNEDVLGTTRPQGAAYDMGAYEFITSDSNAVAPTINTSFAENETASTAVCHTDVVSNGGAPIIERGVIVSYIENFDPDTTGFLCSIKEEFDEAEYSTLVSGLEPSSKYYYLSFAENRMGYSYGQQEVLNTTQMTTDTDSILYVKVDGNGDGSSWENALNGNDIQAAIDYDNTKQVWITKGTYHPVGWPSGGSTDREKHYRLRGGVEIYGGFDGTETNLFQRDYKLNETIFSGDIGVENDSTDNCNHIFINYSLKYDELHNPYFDPIIDSTAVLDGFTITKGFDDDSHYFKGGAGIYNPRGNPVIRNCLFKNNHSYHDGGAIEYDLTDYEGYLIVRIENCRFINNSTKGDGGAIHLWNLSGETILKDCIFSQNSGPSGSALHIYDRTYIQNCLFYDNYGGSTILNDYSAGVNISNTTIANNTGGGLYFDCIWAYLTNTVLFNNGTEIMFGYHNTPTPDINNCAIEGELDFDYTGENNITLSSNNAGDPFSPYFSDPDNNNYMIQEYSPLRNAGIWTDDVPLYDLAGLERDSLPDIGCYEYDVTSIDNGQLTMDNCELYQNYPNPFNPSTSIRFYINKTDKVKLLLYNVAGQLVKKILDKELKAGNHSILFEASDLNSGMYYYTLKTQNTKMSRKMLLLK